MTSIGYSDYFPNSQFQMCCLACLGKKLPNDNYMYCLMTVLARSRGSHNIRYALYLKNLSKKFERWNQSQELGHSALKALIYAARALVSVCRDQRRSLL